MGYCVITADVKSSRENPDRQSLQERLLARIAEVNKTFHEKLLVKFSISLGDEWQGVLKDISASYDVVTFFQENLHPLRIIFGVGEGGIATEIYEESTDMDGEAFHRSREALDYGKKHEQDVYFITGNENRDRLLNVTLHLLQIIKESWTERQTEKIMLYKKLGKERLVASELGISQADVNKTLASKYGKIVLHAQREITHYLTDEANL